MTATEPDPFADAPATYVGVLRSTADLLVAHPELPPPVVAEYGVTWWVYSWEVKDVAAVAASIRRAVGGKWDKSVDDDENRLTLTTTKGGIRFKIITQRAAVCTRRVVGTETVTVPAVEAAPERTVEREVVEWDCDPILADGPPVVLSRSGS
jgi:hypothetical protein